MAVVVAAVVMVAVVVVALVVVAVVVVAVVVVAVVVVAVVVVMKNGKAKKKKMMMNEKGVGRNVTSNRNTKLHI